MQSFHKTLHSFRRNQVVLTSFLRRHLSTHQECFKSTFPDEDIPKVSVAEYVLANFAKWSDKVAVECALTGRKYKYDEVRKKAICFSKALRETLKLNRGDTVAVHLPNLPEYPICALGIFLAGLKLTTINPVYTSEEICKQLNDANAKLIITLNDGVQACKAAVQNLKRNVPFLIIKTKQDELIPAGCINFHDIANSNHQTSECVSLGYHDVIHLPYSSGTTGIPKGVMLTNRNIVANIVQFHSPNHGFINECSGNDQDVLPSILPMFHIYGFVICMLALLQKGCKLVTVPRFTPEVFLNVLDRHRPNIMQLVPPIVVFLNNHEAVKKDYLENVRTILSGAAPLGALDEEKFRRKIGKPVNILQGYGLTETSPSVIATPPALEGNFPGSIGHPLPNTELKIVNPDDPDAKHLGPNKTGELLIRGPQVMNGYFNKPEETEKAFTNGWFRSGDLARYNEAGMFYIEDRIKELIKVKGFQVPPAELEELIRDFPGVAEAAVIGIPDQYAGELPRAYVVPKVGEQVSPTKLQDYIQSKVAAYKKLAGGVAIVDSIPKTTSGKILRKELKRTFENKGI